MLALDLLKRLWEIRAYEASSTCRARFRKHYNDMPGRCRNGKGYVVLRDTDSAKDDIAIPQAHTVTLSANHRHIQQTPCSPQKSCRFAQPAPSYHWNPSPQYDLQELDDGFQNADIAELPSAQSSDVAAKVASKRYPTSISISVIFLSSILINRAGCTSSRMVWEDQGRPRLLGGVFIRGVEVRGPWRLKAGDLYVMQRAAWCVPMCRLLGREAGMFGMLLSEAQVPSTSYYTGMFIYTFIVGLFLTVLSEQKWNDVYFEKVSLKSIGLRVQLGHINSSCILPVPGHQDFIVLHTNSLHYVAVDFCGCNEWIPHRQQLLRCEWFPATVYQPQTCATFRLLELFHVITLTGKLSAHEFYKSLEHLTDNLDINIPKVDVPSNLVFRMLTPFAKTHYRALMRMIRMCRHLKFMKRAGWGNLANGLITT